MFREVIHYFKITFWSCYQLRTYSFFKENGAGLKNQITIILFKIMIHALIVFSGQNHITFIFIKMMSHDLLVQMVYCQLNYYLCLFCTTPFTILESLSLPGRIDLKSYPRGVSHKKVDFKFKFSII